MKYSFFVHPFDDGILKDQRRIGRHKRKRGVRPGELAGFLVLALFIISVVYLAIPSQTFQSNSRSSSAPILIQSTMQKSLLKAAIVDQLGLYSPDSDFTERAKDMMRTAGLSIDVYSPERVTVNLYASLPAHGYRLIVFRVHAGVNEEMQGHPVGLFTTESYSQFKYQQEQLNDLVGSAQAFNCTETVFAVTPKFIRDKSIVNYDSTIVILMGCFGLYSQDLPQAFIDRGASMIVGWNGLVDLEHTDKATLTLLRLMLLQKMNVEQAVTLTMNDVGADSSGSILVYLPLEKGSFSFFEFSELLQADRCRSVLDVYLARQR